MHGMERVEGIVAIIVALGAAAFGFRLHGHYRAAIDYAGIGRPYPIGNSLLAFTGLALILLGLVVAGVVAMAAGCPIGLLSAALAGELLIVVSGDTPEARMQRSFMAMVARLAVVVVLGLAAALSGELSRQPLLFWIGTAYVALLPLEVRLAIL